MRHRRGQHQRAPSTVVGRQGAAPLERPARPRVALEPGPEGGLLGAELAASSGPSAASARCQPGDRPGHPAGRVGEGPVQRPGAGPPAPRRRRPIAPAGAELRGPATVTRPTRSRPAQVSDVEPARSRAGQHGQVTAVAGGDQCEQLPGAHLQPGGPLQVHPTARSSHRASAGRKRRARGRGAASSASSRTASGFPPVARWSRSMRASSNGSSLPDPLRDELGGGRPVESLERWTQVGAVDQRRVAGADREQHGDRIGDQAGRERSAPALDPSIHWASSTTTSEAALLGVGASRLRVAAPTANGPGPWPGAAPTRLAPRAAARPGGRGDRAGGRGRRGPRTGCGSPTGCRGRAAPAGRRPPPRPRRGTRTSPSRLHRRRPARRSDRPGRPPGGGRPGASRVRDPPARLRV
jgi:hypothetical protein